MDMGMEWRKQKTESQSKNTISCKKLFVTETNRNWLNGIVSAVCVTVFILLHRRLKRKCFWVLSFEFQNAAMLKMNVQCAQFISSLSFSLSPSLFLILFDAYLHWHKPLYQAKWNRMGKPRKLYQTKCEEWAASRKSHEKVKANGLKWNALTQTLLLPFFEYFL